MRILVFVLASLAAIVAVLIVLLARLGHLGSAVYFDCSLAGLTAIYGLVEARFLSRGRSILRPLFIALLLGTGLTISVIRVCGDFVPVNDAATSRILRDPRLIEKATRQSSPSP